MSDSRAVNDLVDTIRDMIQQELNKKDQTILCKVREQKDEDHYDLNIVPGDETSVVRNVPNMTKFELKAGDYVYVYKINNQISNAFICYKITPYIK